MRSLIWMFFLSFVSGVLYAQCLDVESQSTSPLKFVTQSALENFFNEYPECIHFGEVIIEGIVGSLDPVEDLSPLENVQTIEVLSLTGDNISSLSGLDNIGRIGSLNIKLSHLQDASALETVGEIGKASYHFNNVHVDDLSLFENVSIKERLILQGNGYLTGFTLKENKFYLRIDDNHYENSFIDLLLNRPDSLSLMLVNSSRFSFAGFENIYQMDDLLITGCDSLNFEGFLTLRRINYLTIINTNFKQDINSTYFEKLYKIYGQVSIGNIDQLGSLSELFPNLQEVGWGMAIWKNDNLFDINLLNDLGLSRESEINELSFISESYKNTDRVIIYDNPNLENCSQDYFCRMLKAYPDQVQIYNNGTEGCFLNAIESWCSTVSSTEIKESTFINVYPNPTQSLLFLDFDLSAMSFSRYFSIHLYDLQGKSLIVDQNASSIDISNLDSGVYVLELRSGIHVERHRIVKY